MHSSQINPIHQIIVSIIGKCLLRLHKLSEENMTEYGTMFVLNWPQLYSSRSPRRKKKCGNQTHYLIRDNIQQLEVGANIELSLTPT